MLFVIATVGMEMHDGRMLRQSKLRRELGVSAATVSIMVRALETLGLVRRSKACCGDRRQVEVTLTRKGSALLRRIAAKIIRPGIVWMALYSIFRMDGGRLGGLHYRLDELRRALFDTSHFYFPWCDRTLFPERRFKPPPAFRWPTSAKAA
jgi:DNA-binding MarR family transcriptional regulator